MSDHVTDHDLLMAEADGRVETLRRMAAKEEARREGWLIEDVLRHDADLIEQLANELHEARQLLRDLSGRGATASAAPERPLGSAARVMYGSQGSKEEA